jgi:adenylate cyclase
VSVARRGGRSRLRPTGTIIVTRVRLPEAARSARATVLFADLRGYTGMAERLSPVQVLPLLDEFFRVLASAVEAYGGTIFHMAGDGMMAGFGVNEQSAPAPGGEGNGHIEQDAGGQNGSGQNGSGQDGSGARAALAAGHAMLEAFAPIAARWRSELSIDAGIGVGLHLGEVAVGSLGPPLRQTTTLVGDTVNVAARLCSRARAGEVLFSCTVAAALENTMAASSAPVGVMPFLQLPQFELRGRRGPIDIWCVPAPERLAL